VIIVINKSSKINDRYQIIRTLGEGGMANVYLAHDTILDRNVAVKILRGDLASDDKFVRRFQREALSASSLSHPNIVEMYDVGEDDGQYYIVMEYVEGKTLKQLLKKRGNLTITEVMDIMLQLTDGMAHAHDSYIIHRDIKPQNIMILENGMIKITDFGIAMALNSTQLTQTNSVMGSVHYLPPEQANGKGSTIKSDIYSMGILMYELLTGSIPYKGENAVEIALKHLKEPLPSIKIALPNLPQSIENIILKSTAKNPKNRYSDAREMYEDIKTALNESRMNEPRFVYKYSENDLDETKVLDDTVKAVEKKRVEEAEKIIKENESMEKQESKKQNKLLVILLYIFTCLILIVTVFILVYFSSNKIKNVTIPDVSAKSVVEASNILTDLGFNVLEETKSVPSDDIEKGYVVKTSPEIGRKVKEGTKIILYVSSGEETFTLEDYAGKNYIETKAILESVYGCNVLIEYEKVTDEKADETKIIRTNPAAGEDIKKGSSITLFLPELEVKYPDFTDGSYTIEDVEEFCEKNDLTIEVKYQEDETVSEGTIIRQSRPADTVVVPGIKFTITVSTLPVTDDETTEGEE
jgi:serine/threonine-protein kinase